MKRRRFLTALKNMIAGPAITKGLFITGTDTGVGKTYVAAGIAAALAGRGVNVGVMKPAETGCRMNGGSLVPADAVRLMRAARSRDDLDLVNPYRFRKPLAPAVAAGIAGSRIDIRKIMRAFRTLSRSHASMIVEGAGGIMVPLDQGQTYLDLARLMGLPVLVVARPGLGTVNHALLTIAALRAQGLAVAGVAINHTTNTPAGLAERTSPAVIETMSGIPIVANIPWGSNLFDDLLSRLSLG